MADRLSYLSGVWCRSQIQQRLYKKRFTSNGQFAIALVLICAGLAGAVVTIFWTLVQGGMLLF